MALTLPLSADDLVEEVVRDFPAAVGLLRREGVVCIQCGEPVWGTLGEVIEQKGLLVEEVLARLSTALEGATSAP